MNVQKQILNTAHNAVVFQRRIRVLAEHIANSLDDRGSVLDVGCGDGSIASAVMDRKPGLSFQGIDVMLRPHVSIPAQAYDGVTIPFEDKSFDWVTIVDVLHHTDDPAAVLGECVRVARHGVVIKDHLREGLAAQSTLRAMDWVGNRGHDVRLPYNYLSKAEWNGIFSRLDVQADQWNEDLNLYAIPFTFLFDRSLHFVAAVSPRN
jgi:SAM-dependent methyltransferase